MFLGANNIIHAPIDMGSSSLYKTDKCCTNSFKKCLSQKKKTEWKSLGLYFTASVTDIIHNWRVTLEICPSNVRQSVSLRSRPGLVCFHHNAPETFTPVNDDSHAQTGCCRTSCSTALRLGTDMSFIAKLNRIGFCTGILEARFRVTTWIISWNKVNETSLKLSIEITVEPG